VYNSATLTGDTSPRARYGTLSIVWRLDTDR
jgi:hypothetical protein